MFCQFISNKLGDLNRFSDLYWAYSFTHDTVNESIYSNCQERVDNGISTITHKWTEKNFWNIWNERLVIFINFCVCSWFVNVNLLLYYVILKMLTFCN